MLTKNQIEEMITNVEKVGISAKSKMINSIFLEDRKVYVTTIKESYSSEQYEIDGKIISTEYGKNFTFESKELPVIKSITKNKVIDHYIYTPENIGVTVKYYNELKSELYAHYKPSEYNDDDDDTCFEWDSLESEYAYKRFNRDYSPIYKDVVMYSDALPITIITAKYDTGIPYIKSLYTVNGQAFDQYIYDPNECKYWTFISLMTKYNVKHSPDIRTNENTWDNTDRKHYLEFVKINGHYLHDNSFFKKIEYCPRGTFDDLYLRYMNDVTRTTEIVIKHLQQYGKNIPAVTLNDSISKELIEKLGWCRDGMKKIKVHAKSIPDYNGLCRLLKEMDESLTKYIMDNFKGDTI